jgi:hypothetical protein
MAKDADTRDARGDDQWSQYINTFKPVEEKMASDAMNYDSPQEMERRANQAGADVESQFDGATARAREMAAMGINPASGRFGDDSIAMAKAAAKAGAMNTRARACAIARLRCAQAWPPSGATSRTTPVRRWGRPLLPATAPSAT